MTDQAVRVERSGPVTTVFLHRPARRNELAALPQDCLRSDRASVLDAEGLDEAGALSAEFAHGREALRSSEAGAGRARFAAGAGRHGGAEPRPE